MHGLLESHLNLMRCDNLIGGENLCFHRFLRFYTQQREKHDY